MNDKDGDYYKNIRILSGERKLRFALCKKYEGNIDNFVSTFPILAKNEYVIWGDKIFTLLH